MVTHLNSLLLFLLTRRSGEAVALPLHLAKVVVRILARALVDYVVRLLASAVCHHRGTLIVDLILVLDGRRVFMRARRLR